jgi:hypothetical protein
VGEGTREVLPQGGTPRTRNSQLGAIFGTPRDPRGVGRDGWGRDHPGGRKKRNLALYILVGSTLMSLADHPSVF